MGLINTVTSMIDGGDDETYHYQCGDCGTEFESAADHPSDAECPECGSESVHTAV